MTSLKTFASETKTMDSRFMKSIYIFDIFHFLIAANGKKAEYEKGKSMPLGSELSV